MIIQFSSYETLVDVIQAIQERMHDFYGMINGGCTVLRVLSCRDVSPRYYRMYGHQFCTYEETCCEELRRMCPLEVFVHEDELRARADGQARDDEPPGEGGDTDAVPRVSGQRIQPVRESYIRDVHMLSGEMWNTGIIAPSIASAITESTGGSTEARTTARAPGEPRTNEFILGQLHRRVHR